MGHMFFYFILSRGKGVVCLAVCRISMIVSILIQAKIYAWSAYPESNLLD